MTDLTPAEDLAAQLAELRSQVARCLAQVTAWDARLDREGIGGTMVLLLEVKKLRERLEMALDKRMLTPPPPPWWVVGEPEGRAMLAELAEWVDGFLRRHYSGYLDKILPCWPNHPEAVWELSTLRAEWQRIYSDEDNRDLQGALTWHDRYLPGVLARIGASITCDQSGCRRVRPPGLA